MKRVDTYNSKTNTDGNRLNLVLNHDTKQYYFYGCNVFNKGNVHNKQLQKDIKRIKEYYVNEEHYTAASHEVAREW